MAHPRVVNIKHLASTKEKGALPADVVYIGHQMPPSMSPTGRYLPASKWRNPFNRAFRKHLITRRESIDLFLMHVLASPDLMAALPEIRRPRLLGCYCAPEECHGDVLARLADGPA